MSKRIVQSEYIKSLQQQLYYLELENSYLKQRKNCRCKFQGSENGAAKKNDFEESTNSKFDEKISESRNFQSKFQNQKIHSKKDFRNLEREQMTEEILQLRKKLDDLLPTLTKKEVQLAEMQVELQEAYGRINAAKNAFAVLKQQLGHKNQEEELMQSNEIERKMEIEQLTRLIRGLEEETASFGSKIRLQQEEIYNLQSKLREKELEKKHADMMYDKISEENAALIRENAELSTNLLQKEQNFDDSENRKAKNNHFMSELITLKEIERQLRHDLLKMHDQFKLEQARVEALENDKRDQESQKLRFHDQLSNLQVRVEELQLKITQLSTENRQIRKEKLLKDQQLKDIQAMAKSKAEELDDVNEKLHGITVEFEIKQIKNS